ncbi:MAG: regulatory protein RecX [Propionibacteriaceae bacterium]|nr:regulatory protein RecX [Propionibacteriaceae bacterium]
MSGSDRETGEEEEGNPVAIAREIALRQLTVRARSRAELARALKRKGTPDEVSGEVLDRLEEVGLVDDAAFAREWLAAGDRRRRSRSALLAELAEKGVAREVVDEAVAELDSDRDYVVARGYAETKLAGLARVEPSARYRRLAGALARRGFAAGVVAQVTREVLAELRDGADEDADPSDFE